MKKPAKRQIIGRLGAPTNLRQGGVMESANKKYDARRHRKRIRAALRRSDVNADF